MLTKWLTPFGITVHEKPIRKVQPTKAIDTGIKSEFQIPGNVPWYEEHNARIQAGYNLNEWYELHYLERTMEVAHYRVRWMIDLMKNEALLEKQEIDMARARSKRKGRR